MPFEVSKLDLFPTQPGVYLMKDRSNEVIYVGKANNIRQRVRQYFAAGGDGRQIIPFLVPKIETIETIIVTSEKEALLLENNLIKQYQPRYNALLKDDKSFIALKMTTKETWPLVELVRYRGKPKADGTYFGPYTSAYSARRTLDLIHKVFPLRQCSNQEFARRTRPCILYQMQRCIAPCVGLCTKEEYQDQVDRTARFLKGQDKEILKELYEEMEKSAEALDFEHASALLKTIRQIETTIEIQRVDKPLGLDTDAWGIYRQASELILSQLIFRGGKLVGSRHFNFSNIAQDDDELFSSFLLQEYEREDELPHEILVPVELPDRDAVNEILSANKRRKVDVQTPQRGDKRALIEMAYNNAKATFQQQKNEDSIREKILMEMQENFHLTQYPKRIECFDNSNISGTEPVSSLVTFTDGQKDSKRYRKYKIRSLSTPDDYGTMREVLLRRYKRGKEENDLPDLVVIDGGKGHLNVALKVFEELNIITVNVISVAKEQGRHDKGMTSEQVFLPNIKDPILLKKNSPILFLLQQIRDEAHRFAITFHRSRRSKATISSQLDSVPGIGPAKRKALLRHFGSVKKITAATLEQMMEVEGISKRNAEEIQLYFKSNATPEVKPDVIPDSNINEDFI